MTLYYNTADHSFWLEAPPGVAGVPINSDDEAMLSEALRRGHLPRLENEQWVIYTPDNPPLDVMMHTLRHERDNRLRDCDWTQMADAEIAPTKRQAWADYRRALRRLPQDHPDGKNVVWPAKPE